MDGSCICPTPLRMNTSPPAPSALVLPNAQPDDAGLSLTELLSILRAEWRLIAGGTFAAGVLALGVAFLIPPTFTARTSLLPPQQQQGGAAAALSNLGALAGLAGGGISTTSDKYVALLQSETISNRIIDKYKLLNVYDAKFRVDAQKELSNNMRVAAGKKDGIIAIEIDDKSPERAAAMANSYIDELRQLTNSLAVTEAQQRRVFFEQQLQQTKAKLIDAQVALQSSGFSEGALKAEPKAAADTYAKLRAEVTSAEIKLQTMRRMLADNAPEVIQQQATATALRNQLSNLEKNTAANNQADYIGRYREFKYQETLFDLFARQYELARVDESREGTLIQVLDVATVPERKSKPKRGLIILGSITAAAALLSQWAIYQRISRKKRLLGIK